MVLRLALIALGLGLALPAAAGSASELPPLKRARTAHDLYRIGVEGGDPLLILAAARLRKTVAMTAADRAPEGGSAATGTPLGWAEMLAAAAPLMEGDPLMQGLAEDIAADTAKGVASGPVYSIVRIGAGGRDRYPQLTFTGGQYAEVYVEGPSGTDLNLLVHDDKGRLVCSDTDISAIAYCGWRPAVSGSFTITVENDGPQGGQYAMMTN